MGGTTIKRRKGKLSTFVVSEIKRKHFWGGKRDSSLFEIIRQSSSEYTRFATLELRSTDSAGQVRRVMCVP